MSAPKTGRPGMLQDRREAVARIIDPNAFAGVYSGELVTGFVADRQKAALAKADEVLALPALQGAEPAAWTGSGSLASIAIGLGGYIWRDKAASCPIPLYASPPASTALAEITEKLEPIICDLKVARVDANSSVAIIRKSGLDRISRCVVSLLALLTPTKGE